MVQHRASAQTNTQSAPGAAFRQGQTCTPALSRPGLFASHRHQVVLGPRLSDLGNRNGVRRQPRHGPGRAVWCDLLGMPGLEPVICHVGRRAVTATKGSDRPSMRTARRNEGFFQFVASSPAARRCGVLRAVVIHIGTAVPGTDMERLVCDTPSSGCMRTCP